MRTVVFDLDSTIRDTRPRRSLCPTVNPESTWDRYHAAGWGDPPLAGGLRLAALLQLSHDIIVTTFAPEWNRVSTEHWLGRHMAWRRLVMHDGRYGDDSLQFHVSAMRMLLGLGLEIDLVVQDQPKIAVAIQNEFDIPVLCVNPCYAELSALAGLT